MRGKDFEPVSYCCGIRITPAYAGKSLLLCEHCGKPMDHPRLCGEKSRYSVTLWITAGSPPPMRGKVTFLIDTVFPARITPAYAGKRLHDGGGK